MLFCRHIVDSDSDKWCAIHLHAASNCTTTTANAAISASNTKLSEQSLRQRSVGRGINNRCEIITNVRKFICIFCTSLRQEQTQCATKDYRRIFVLFLQASLSVSQAVCEITKFTTDNLRVKTTKSSKINQQFIVCCMQCVQKVYIYEIVQNWAGG